MAALGGVEGVLMRLGVGYSPKWLRCGGAQTRWFAALRKGPYEAHLNNR